MSCRTAIRSGSPAPRSSSSRTSPKAGSTWSRRFEPSIAPGSRWRRSRPPLSPPSRCTTRRKRSTAPPGSKASGCSRSPGGSPATTAQPSDARLNVEPRRDGRITPMCFPSTRCGATVPTQPRCCVIPGGRQAGGWDVEWMLLAALGIMWGAFLVPRGRKRSEARSVTDFEQRIELLANAEVHGTTGRWIVTPRKGVRFLGPDDRRRARARERRRKVFVVLLDAIVLTSLMGVAPPLRAMWYVAAGFGVVLILYMWVLLSLKGRAQPPGRVPGTANGLPSRTIG